MHGPMEKDPTVQSMAFVVRNKQLPLLIHGRCGLGVVDSEITGPAERSILHRRRPSVIGRLQLHPLPLKCSSPVSSPSMVVNHGHDHSFEGQRGHIGRLIMVRDRILLVLK